MSYYQEYRLINSVYNSIPSLEDNGCREDISVEGLSFKKIIELINKAIKSIKEFFIKIYTWIKEKVSKFFNNRTTKKKIENIERFIDLLYTAKIYKEVDITSFIKDQYLSNSSHGGGHGVIVQYMLFDNKGNAFDLNNIIKFIEKQKEVFLDESNTKSIEDNFNFNNVVMTDYLKETFSVADWDNITFTVEGVFKNIKKLSYITDKVMDYAEKNKKVVEGKIKELEKKVQELEKNIDDYDSNEEYKQTMGRLKGYQHYIRLTTLPVELVLRYTQLLSSTAKHVSHSDWLVTDDVPTKLYHLSKDDSLPDELVPRIGGTNSGQYMPPRVSFSGDYLNACHGTPFNFEDFDEPDKYPKGTLRHEDFYVYEAIVEKGKTKRIRDEIIQGNLHGLEYFYSKEVAITTPIKVKLKEKIRVYYKYGYDWLDPNKFVRYEKIN